MIEQILKDSAYKLSQFKQDEISAIEEKIYKKSNNKFYMKCLIRDREIQLKPEEVIRQLFIYKLLNHYGYKKSQIKIEHGINFGHEVKRADIVIVNKDHADAAYIIVEVKRPDIDSGEEQLKSYCHVSGAPVAVWTNGEKIAYWTRQDKNIFVDIPDIPNANQTLEEMQAKLWYILDLVKNDILSKGNTTLSKLIKELEDEVLANAGVDAFEEVFKLIFSKLYDEYLSDNDDQRYLHFRNYIIYKDSNEKGAKEYNDEQNKQLAATIQNLFNGAKDEWKGVFAPNDKIELTPSHLVICISKLQNVKLFNSNLEVIDEAFEHLMNKSQKGEKGQYFTPRYVIDMCVKMLNPKRNEKMIDTAAGSCGFPVHTIFHVCGSKFTAKNKSHNDITYVRDNVFAIDFDEKAVRVARTLNLIAGDGKTNVIRLNTLDYKNWAEVVANKAWRKKYLTGWDNLDDLCEVDEDYQNFNFDIVMANPPFAGDVKEKEIIKNYELAKKPDGKYQTKMSRDVLFIERNLQFLKPGGRMAIVLPQGRFNNSSDKYIRDFIAERCRILAVVGLHGNVFKPHTGTKTSVLFVQKWDDTLCPRRDDYPIFFATMQKPSKDNSGEKIYVATADGLLRDSHNHLIVDHDLFNYDGLTADGIAEAFIEFAKKENLSFFDSSSFDENHYKNLLEGLECTEILLSEIDKNLFRLEAEFYQKKYLALEKKLADNFNLGQFAKKIECGPFGSNLLDTEYLPDGVLVVRPFNLKNLVVENDNLVYISENLVAENHLKIYNRNTLLFSRVGDIKIGILNRDAATISPNIIAVEFKNPELAKFFAVFFNTYAGFTQIARQLKVAAQPTISTDIIKNLKVFINDKIISEVIKIFDLAQNKLQSADEVYKSAEKILAQALHLEDFKPSTKNTAEVSFSSFLNSGRLDAEFFMPKYDDLQKFLEKLPTAKLADVVTIFKSIEPGSDFYSSEGVPFIRVSDINKFGIAEPDIKLSLKVDKNLYPCKDTILFSKDGSVGIAYKVRENLTAVTSGALLHLKLKTAEILPDYLTLYLNSKPVQMLAERYTNGAIIQHWRISDIEKIPVPILPMATQTEIAALVEKSFNLRAESERLLEVAKSAVEMAIESGEDVAIKFLNRGENIGD